MNPLSADDKICQGCGMINGKSYSRCGGCGKSL